MLRDAGISRRTLGEALCGWGKFGHHCLLVTHVNDMSDEELEKAIKVMFSRD
ncbi:hypothetical protein [Methanosarcina sp. MSH10X1]|uniref:hypothetical protein n=1 Tax=Methanosarcina sp. MSH10X1 TaxID=2507075 RepID=UPI0013E3F5E1|nr:hypothetical protein [Methanosarcina sp. MSH10X1]